MSSQVAQKPVSRDHAGRLGKINITKVELLLTWDTMVEVIKTLISLATFCFSPLKNQENIKDTDLGEQIRHPHGS